MADEKKVELPDVEKIESKKDVEKTLDGILGWVQKKKAQAEDPQTTTTKSSPWGWVAGLAVAVLVFFALAFLAWRAWAKGREIALLKHELDRKKEEEEQAKLNARMETNHKQRVQLESRAVALAAQSERITTQLKKAEEERKLAHDTIDKVTSWEDVDKIIGSPDGKPTEKPNG